MTDLLLHLHLDGQALPPRAVPDGTPAALAAAVHRHARGHLGSRRVTIHLNEDGLTGTVLSHGTPAGTFTLTEEQPAPNTTPGHRTDTVLHGYTLTDLHHMAAAACAADRLLASDAHTRYDTAWSAIAEALAAATTPPDRQTLIRTGWQAIYTEVRQMGHLFGVQRADTTAGVASAHRYVQYWTVLPAAPEEGLVERLAVHQVLDTLTPLYRDAVTALAVHGDYQRAADALGINYKAFTRRMQIARRQLRALWFAPDTAPPARGTDRRVGAYGKTLPTHCGAGHPWTVENTRWGHGRGIKGAKVRRCRACERDRSRARRALAAA